VPPPAEIAAPKRIILAAPRGYFVLARPAVQTVERRSSLHGPPVYVRKEIVHNSTVVKELAEPGAIFVEEETEVPEGALVVFSAHGVAPQRARQLRGSQPTDDRRHLSAGDQGPRRGAQVR